MPVWIIDTTNDFGDLADNKNMFKVIKANKVSAGLLPAKLKRTRQSVIIKFTYLKDLQDKRKWMTEFLKACFDKVNDKPAMIIIDEVHRFCPQKEPKDATRRECREWVNNLLSDGRKHGYGSMIISQRTSKVDKDTLAECESVLIHRHTLKNDLDRLEGYIGEFGINAREEVPRLKVGEVFDVSFKDFTYEKYRIPLDRTKRLGRTPKSVGVDPIKEDLWDKIKDVDMGIDREEKIIALGVGVLLVLIIIIMAVAFNLKNDSIVDDGD